MAFEVTKDRLTVSGKDLIAVERALMVYVNDNNCQEELAIAIASGLLFAIDETKEI